MNDRAAMVRRGWPAAAVAVIALILAIALGSRDGADPGGRSAAPDTAGTTTSTGTPGGSTASDGLPTVSVEDLPPEARSTIDLIDRGGPYPYDQDDSVFQNREGRLPDQPRGSYREYTVETPGESDRGPRRIVKARDGTLYYTDDHYESFRRVQR